MPKNFIRGLGKDLLKSALPSALQSVPDLFRSRGDSSTAKKIEDAFTSEQTRLEFEKLALSRLETSNEFELKLKDYELKEKEQEIENLKSARDFAKNDNEFGSRLSRNVRPAILIAVTSAFIILLFAMFTVSSVSLYRDIDKSVELINIFETLLGFLSTPLTTLFMFYFGARSVEKIGHEYMLCNKKETK